MAVKEIILFAALLIYFPFVFRILHRSTISANDAAEWIRMRGQEVRSWGSFADPNKFSRPASVSQAVTRILRNIEYFQNNYIIVFIGLTVYCLLTSPLIVLALAISVTVCCVAQHWKNYDEGVKIFGHELTPTQQQISASLISIMLLILSGAGTVIFWLIGVFTIFILSHSICYAYEA